VLGILVYLGVFYFAIHDALFPFQHYVYMGNSASVGQEAAVIFRPFIYGANPNPDLYPPGMFFLFSLAGGIIAMIKREKNVFFISVIYFLFIAYMLLGSSSSSFFLTGHDYGQTIPIVTRMFAIMISPISILCAYALFSIFKVVRKGNSIRAAIAVTFAVFVVIALLNLPEYAFLRAVNSGISHETQALYGLSSSIIDISRGSNATVYISAPDSFPFIFASAMEYTSGFDSRLAFLSINSTAPTGSMACKNPSPKSFLVSSYLQESATMVAWLGQNCTATLLGNFTDTSQIWYFNFALYSIKPE
jgi:hypothetical protein